MRPTFTLHKREIDSVTVLYLEGPLRLGACESVTGMQLSEVVKRLYGGGSRLVAIDLRGLARTPDSSGLGELVAAQAALRRCGGDLILVNVPRRLRDLIAMMRLEPLLRVADTEEDAVTLLRVQD
jgi:anti-anti-sigma factor